LAVGAILATKFSGMLLLPVVGAGLLIQHVRDFNPPRPVPLLKTALLVGGMAVGVLACAYQGEPFRPYWEGYRGMQQSWNAFLLGRTSTEGFYLYFPLVWLLKTPPSTQLLLLLALATLPLLRPSRTEWLLLLSSLFFLTVSAVLRINIGVRHILPVLAPLLLLTPRLLQPELWNLPWFQKRVPGGLKLASLTAVGLSSLTALEVAAAHPHYTAYFSSLAGGPWEGHRYLSDSNLDWGQDLKRLAEWNQAQGGEPLLLGTFTNIVPGRLGLTYQTLPSFGALGLVEHALPTLPARVRVAMSAINLQGVYFDAAHFTTLQPIDGSLYHFLLDRPPLVRLTPSLWIWDLTDDPEALRRLVAINLNFGWKASAASLLEAYVRKVPADTQAAAALDQLRSPPPAP
jgi:hypothetical protein